ncbi:MAG: hypothetical protein ACKOV8_01995, partial [Phycisphaerales bacterium]
MHHLPTHARRRHQRGPEEAREGDAREGARIPVARTAEGVRYLVHEGQEVWSRMDERVLRDTALAGEGAYIPAGTERVDMARAYAQTVGLLERQESDASTVTR